MPSMFMNRRDESDIVDSGSYQVSKDKQVRVGYPLKESGSIGGAVLAPPSTKYQLVEEYTDTTSVAACVGISEKQIPKLTGSVGAALRNIEFRHFDRNVSVCKFGVRGVINKDPSQTTANTGSKLAPYPGGFRIWSSGMAELGTLKRGPVVYDAMGEVVVNVLHVQT